MGYPDLLRGHVGSIARGITVANATRGQAGLAEVNPIFHLGAARAAHAGANPD